MIIAAATIAIAGGARISRRVETTSSAVICTAFRPHSSRISRRVETHMITDLKGRGAAIGVLESQEGLKLLLQRDAADGGICQKARISRRVETKNRGLELEECECFLARISRRVETYATCSATRRNSLP